MRYNHKEIEAKWQRLWEESGAFVIDGESGSSAEAREKYYVLEMFPYPSGKIHMGHVRNYSIGDVIARFFRMRGKDVLHPMGWDSFGLPAENAAIENNIHPKKWTHDNIDNMRSQLKQLGLSYDWAREIMTCTPEYYKWNQWLFIKLFKEGLAYKKRSAVNWCPNCSTVLANEQVEDGVCWRCESVVELKELEQWFFKTTAYAEELLQGTEKLKGWPERVLTMQRNWIGKSVGAEVDFPLVDDSGEVIPGEVIRIFTTRPDTLYGVTFMSLAAEHPLVEKITSKDKIKEVRQFAEKVKQESALREGDDFEKEGIFTGAYCLNPLTGEKVPVYVANFVLMGYGTGAVMAVPAHDERDFEFAKKYELPIKVVITPEDEDVATEVEEAFTDEGVMMNSAEFDNMKSSLAKAAITEKLHKEGKGEKSITYRLRDWGISRQRFWGTPIPIVYCDKCGAVPVKETELPVVLPDDVDFKAAGLSPLESVKDFVETTCPKCDAPARRETDTMDTFVDSSWYFLRYLSPKDTTQPFSKEEASRLMPIDQYIGGIEHAVMHLLYARFFTMAIRDLGLLDKDFDGEPFKNLLTQGMVCKETMRCAEHGYLLPEEVKDGKCAECGKAITIGAVEKMSKSKKNTIDPDGIIARYGADTTRLFSLFAAPPERDLDWNVEGVEGSYRFLSRVWRIVNENIELIKSAKTYDKKAELSGYSKELHRVTHATIKKVTEDVEKRFHFNTAISAVMELTNLLYKGEWKDNRDKTEAMVFKEAVTALVQLLSPFAPHMSEELWEMLGSGTHLPLYKTPWPSYDESALATDEVVIIVQVNGKLRAKVTVPAASSKESVEGVVMKDAKVLEWIEGKEVKKIIYVPDKIFNMVVQ
jgi:leucyl-tRNA synthetase